MNRSPFVAAEIRLRLLRWRAQNCRLPKAYLKTVIPIAVHPRYKSPHPLFKWGWP